jgi:hypothetical protein
VRKELNKFFDGESWRWWQREIQFSRTIGSSLSGPLVICFENVVEGQNWHTGAGGGLRTFVYLFV